jgi:hypothetical protein
MWSRKTARMISRENPDNRPRCGRANKEILENVMARRKRKYSRSAGRDVESEMRRYKRGTARSGRGGKGGKVKSRKQAIAIGLSKARKQRKKVPKKKSA